MTGDYAPQVIDGVQCIWLQGIGWHGAKPLGDVQVGDVLAYNYGSTATVISVYCRGRSSVIMTVESNGKRYETNARRAPTLVAVKGVGK